MKKEPGPFFGLPDGSAGCEGKFFDGIDHGVGRHVGLQGGHRDVAVADGLVIGAIVWFPVVLAFLYPEVALAARAA